MSYSYDSVKLANRSDWILNKLACIPNNKLDSTTLRVVIGISQQYVERSIPHMQMMKLWYQGIQDYCGLSEDSIGKGISKLEKANAGIRDRKAEINEQGVKVNRIWFCFTPEFLSNPASLFQDVEESNHGGKRIKKHKGCGGEIVNLCTGCGETHIPDDQIYYVPAQVPERNTDELARLDETVAAIEMYGDDVISLPDEIVDQLGGVEQAMSAHPIEIAHAIKEREELAQEASAYTEGWYSLNE